MIDEGDEGWIDETSMKEKKIDGGAAIWRRRMD